MESGYNILWTDNALEELHQTFEYLERNFSKREIIKLAHKIDSITELISRNPLLFSKSEQQGIHRVTILRYNTMYYRIKRKDVHILSFFSNRQNPMKRRL